MQQVEKMHTTSETAKILGISMPTMRKLANSGLIEHYMIGSHRRFSDTQIQNYLARAVFNG